MKTNQEKLQLIKAKCQELLTVAEKRTPGKWDTLGVANSDSLRLFAKNHYLGSLGNSDSSKLDNQTNSIFIASCAGPAEAGWKATIETIDWLLEMKSFNKLSLLNGGSLEALLISAWEDQL